MSQEKNSSTIVYYVESQSIIPPINVADDENLVTYVRNLSDFLEILQRVRPRAVVVALHVLPRVLPDWLKYLLYLSQYQGLRVNMFVMQPCEDIYQLSSFLSLHNICFLNSSLQKKTVEFFVKATSSPQGVLHYNFFEDVFVKKDIIVDIATGIKLSHVKISEQIIIYFESSILFSPNAKVTLYLHDTNKQFSISGKIVYSDNTNLRYNLGYLNAFIPDESEKYKEILFDFLKNNVTFHPVIRILVLSSSFSFKNRLKKFSETYPIEFRVPLRIKNIITDLAKQNPHLVLVDKDFIEKMPETSKNKLLLSLKGYKTHTVHEDDIERFLKIEWESLKENLYQEFSGFLWIKPYTYDLNSWLIFQENVDNLSLQHVTIKSFYAYRNFGNFLIRFSQDLQKHFYIAKVVQFNKNSHDNINFITFFIFDGESFIKNIIFDSLKKFFKENFLDSNDFSKNDLHQKVSDDNTDSSESSHEFIVDTKNKSNEYEIKLKKIYAKKYNVKPKRIYIIFFLVFIMIIIVVFSYFFNKLPSGGEQYSESLKKYIEKQKGK